MLELVTLLYPDMSLTHPLVIQHRTDADTITHQQIIPHIQTDSVPPFRNHTNGTTPSPELAEICSTTPSFRTDCPTYISPYRVFATETGFNLWTLIHLLHYEVTSELMGSTELTPYFLHTDDELGTTTMNPLFWTIPALAGTNHSLSFDIFTAQKIPANYRYSQRFTTPPISEIANANQVIYYTTASDFKIALSSEESLELSSDDIQKLITNILFPAVSGYQKRTLTGEIHATEVTRLVYNTHIIDGIQREILGSNFAKDIDDIYRGTQQIRAKGKLENVVELKLEQIIRSIPSSLEIPVIRFYDAKNRQNSAIRLQSKNLSGLGISMRMITGKFLQSINMNILPYADANIQITFPVPKGSDYLQFGILINKDLAYGAGPTDLLHLFLLRDGSVILEMKKPVGVVGDNVRELFNTAISFFIENQINPILLNNPYLARRTTTETGPKTSINADTLQLINIHLNREITLTTPLKEKDLVKRLNNFQKYGLTELRDPEKSLVWNPANLKQEDAITDTLLHLQLMGVTSARLMRETIMTQQGLDEETARGAIDKFQDFKRNRTKEQLKPAGVLKFTRVNNTQQIMEISGSPSWDDLVLISYLGQWVLTGDISGIASTKTRGRPKKATASPKEEELAEVVAEEDENIVDDDIEGTGLVGMVEPVDLFGEEPGELEIGGLELGGDEEDGLDLFAEMDEDGVEEIHLEELTGELGEPANEPVAPKEEAGVEEEEEDITVDLGKTKILPSSFLLSKVLKPRNPQIFGQQYARKCAATDGRQPLILTRRQLLDVIATNPASLGYNKTIEGHDGEVTPELMKTWQEAKTPESLELLGRALNDSVISIQKNQDRTGDPTKRDYFVCPKQFCALNLRPMTEEQILSGECGGKLQDWDADKTDKTKNTGAYILPRKVKKDDLNIDAEAKEAGRPYVKLEMYPGFMERNKFGYTAPCCFLEKNKTKNDATVFPSGMRGLLGFGEKPALGGEETGAAAGGAADIASPPKNEVGPLGRDVLGKTLRNWKRIPKRGMLNDASEQDRLKTIFPRLKPVFLGVGINYRESLLYSQVTAVIWYLRNQRRDARSAELANEIETDPATETRNADPISNFRRVMLETIGVEDALNIRGGHGVLAFLNMPRGRGPFILQNEEERSEFRTWTREGGTNVLGVAANEAAEEDGVCAADEMRLCIAWRTFKNFRDLIADRDAPKTIDIFWELLTDGSIGRLVNPDIDGNVPGINVLVVQVSNKTGETRLVCPTNPLSEGVDPYYSKNIQMNRGVGTSINTYRRERPTIILIRRDEYIYQPFGFMVDGGRLITGFDQSVYRELGEIGEYVEMSIESLGRQHNLQCSGLFPTDEGYTRIPTRAEVMSEIGDTVASFVVDVQNRVVGVMTEGGLYLPTEPEVYRLTEEELADRDIIEGVIRVPPQTIGFVLRELAVAKFSDFLRGAYTADTIFTNEGIATGLRLKCGGVIPISESADDEEGADAEALPSVESGWSPDINDRLQIDPALAADAVNVSSQDKLVRGMVGHIMLQLNYLFTKNRNPTIESLINFLRHSPISNLEKQQRLTDMLSEIVLKENIIGTTGRTIENIEKAGQDIVEHKEEADDAESGVVRYVIKGLIDDTGNMVRPYFGEEAKMGTDSTQLIERTIVTLSQYLQANPKVGLEEIRGGYIPDRFIVNDIMVSAEGDTFMVQSEVNIPVLMRTDQELTDTRIIRGTVPGNEMRRGNNKFGVDRQVQERVKNISDYWNDNTINLETILFGTENERAGLRGMKALQNGLRSLEEEPIKESLGDVEDVRRAVLAVQDRDARPILTKLGEAKGILAWEVVLRIQENFGVRLPQGVRVDSERSFRQAMLLGNIPVSIFDLLMLAQKQGNTFLVLRAALTKDYFNKFTETIMNRYQVNIWVRGRTDRTVVYESNGHGDAYNLELVTKNGSTRERFTNSSSIYGSGILNQLKKLPRGATIDVSVSSAKDLENVLRSLYTGKVHRVSPDEKDIGGAGVAAAGGGATISAVGPVNELGVREEHEHVEPGTGTCKTPFQYGMDKQETPTNFGQGEMCATDVKPGKRPDMLKQGQTREYVEREGGVVPRDGAFPCPRKRVTQGKLPKKAHWLPVKTGPCIFPAFIPGERGHGTMQSWGCVTSRVNEANPEGIGMFCATEVNEDNIATSVGFCEDYEGTWGSAQKPEGCGGAAAGGAAE